MSTSEPGSPRPNRSLLLIGLGLAVAAVAALVAACGAANDSGSTGSSAAVGAYFPRINPADFVARVDNPWLPYLPGMRLRYRGVMKNGNTPQIDTVQVTHKHRTVMGVRCVVVRDTVRSRGRPVERTQDWYAQDRQGNVWYMGEETAELKHGRFGQMIDSGPAGRNGAKPGIIMEGSPKPGDLYWQFHWPGHALDKAKVLRQHVPETVPYRSFGATLLTQEQSPLEPGIRDWKWSAPGIGYVKEKAHRGSHEQIRLVSFRR
jgi:hypothetical protein